jgi:hypothetical protein
VDLSTNGIGGTQDVHRYLRSFDDTVSKLEYDIDTLSSDFVNLKNQTGIDL